MFFPPVVISIAVLIVTHFALCWNNLLQIPASPIIVVHRLRTMRNESAFGGSYELQDQFAGDGLAGPGIGQYCMFALLWL
jgi:hypothetical protein